MRHHTTDPAERAADIADRESKGKYVGYFEGWIATYQSSLPMLAASPNVDPILPELGSGDVHKPRGDENVS